MHADRKNDTPYILAKRNSKHAILKLLVENGAQAINEVPQQTKSNKKTKSTVKK
jgi:ankyrin repeat protein